MTNMDLKAIGLTVDPDILIGFSTTDSLTSKFIRWWSKSKFTSHSWVSFIARGELRVVVGADEKGLSWTTWDRFIEGNLIPAVFAPQHVYLNEGLNQVLNDYMGAAYDYGAAGLVGIRNRLPWVWRHFGNWLRIVLPDPKDVMCAEVITRMMTHAGCPYLSHWDPETTSAQNLLDVMLGNRQLYEPLFICEKLMPKK